MKRMLTGLITGLCLLLGGCSWKDASDLSPVTAGAITRENGQYLLTAELAIPSADSASPDSVMVFGKASGIPQAIDQTGAGLDAQLYWSHARVLLLDKTLLRDGIRDCIQSLTHSSEVRPTVRLCAVRNTDAASLLDSESTSGDPAGFALGDSISYAIRQSQTPDMPLYRMADRMETAGIDPVLPAVSLKGTQAVLSGSALFSGDILYGWLDEQQTGILSILLADGDTAAIYDTDTRYQLSNIRTEIAAEAGEKPHITVTVQTDVACEMDVQAQQAARCLQEQSGMVISALQQAGCDALGFGRAWQREDADSWKQAGTDAWQTVPVTVHVTCHAVQSAEGGSR